MINRGCKRKYRFVMTEIEQLVMCHLYSIYFMIISAIVKRMSFIQLGVLHAFFKIIILY